ncbi:MAG: hypothetical protein AAF664_05715 [Planctomycetota bacterium]
MSLDEKESNEAQSLTDHADTQEENSRAEEDSLVSPEEETSQEHLELAVPFVGQWNQLISSTNWDKGQIISEWRRTLMDADAPVTAYSDEAWVRRVGGVTAPHIGRLRRVYDRFGESRHQFDGLYWSHFFAALDWDDASLWLEGAVQEGWSVSQMRTQRWESHGAVANDRPTDSQVISVEVDEDVDAALAPVDGDSTQPAQGDGRVREYDDDAGGTSGPFYENADFGDQSEPMPGQSGTTGQVNAPEGGADAEVIQPFAGLPEVPEDLNDAMESLKLAILRHRSSKWATVEKETVEKYVQAFLVLLAQEG